MSDPFAQSDQENAERAKREALLRFQRERDMRRANRPLPEGGLFDEVRRQSRDLFQGD